MNDLTALEVVLITIATVFALVIIGAGIGFWYFDKPGYDADRP